MKRIIIRLFAVVIPIVLVITLFVVLKGMYGVSLAGNRLSQDETATLVQNNIGEFNEIANILAERNSDKTYLLRRSWIYAETIGKRFFTKSQRYKINCFMIKYGFSGITSYADASQYDGKRWCVEFTQEDSMMDNVNGVIYNPYDDANGYFIKSLNGESKECNKITDHWYYFKRW